MTPFHIHHPQGLASAVVLDSPHSGRGFPADFGHCLTERQLRSGEDIDIHELYADAPSLGAPLLEALFSRTYVDPNRAAGDIDPLLLSSPWPYREFPYAYAPSGKASIGKAVVWRNLDDNQPIYGQTLAPEAVKHRIDAYLLPYQSALSQLVDRAHSAHGLAVHINCHSMEPVGGAMSEGGLGKRRADVVLGDRDGSTCDPDLTTWVSDFFRGKGYSVAINDPYKGVELVRQFSNPKAGRHSLQLELNKALYMTNPEAVLASHMDDPFERSAQFPVLKGHLAELVRGLVAWAAVRSTKAPAN